MYKEKNEKFFMEVLNMATKESKSVMPRVIDFGGTKFRNATHKKLLSIDVTNLLNDTINKANDVYMANHNATGKKENPYVKDIDCVCGTAAYTAFTMNTIWTRDVIIRKIGEILTDSKNENWLKENGISSKDIEPMIQEFKDYTLDALKSSERTKPIGDFIESLETKEGDYYKNKHIELIDEMGVYVQTLNNELENLSDSLSKNDLSLGDDIVHSAFKHANEQLLNRKHSPFRSYISTYADNLGIGHEIDSYSFTTDLSQKPVAEDLVRDIGVMLSSQNITILYGDEVHPTDFLDHYKAGNVSEAESKWAGERVNELKNMLTEKFNKKNPGKEQTIDLSCFYANGKQIVTKEEFENAKTPSGDYDPKALGKIEEKIMASMLAGDAITVKTPDKSMQTTVRPMVEPPKKAEFKFGQILQWIYENIFTNKNKEKAKVDAMNDKFEKNEFAANASRIKTSLYELSENGAFLTKRTKPAKSPYRERTTGMNGPQK